MLSSSKETKLKEIIIIRINKNKKDKDVPPPHLGKAQSTIYEKIHNPSLESLVNSEEDIILK